MLNTLRFALSVALAWLLLGAATSAGWEIDLKDQVSMRQAVVRLGDVAVVKGLADEDIQRLQQIVIAPGPSRAYSRSMSVGQLEKVLSQRGVEMDQCDFTGAYRVVVVFDRSHELASDDAAANASSNDSPTSGLSTSYAEAVAPENRAVHYRAPNGMVMVRGIEDSLAEQVNTHFMRLAGDDVPWDVNVKISPQSLRDLPTNWSAVAVEGVKNAVEGDHRLVAHFTSPQGDVRLPVEAKAARKIQLVVAAKPLRRGDTITAEDVEVRYVGTSADDSLETAAQLEDVVGRLVQYPLRADEPIRLAALKKPILVKRREAITVFARRGPILIKSPVMALDAGSLGDVISVERTDGSKERFVARVVGVQQAEVFVSNAVVKQLGKY